MTKQKRKGLYLRALKEIVNGSQNAMCLALIQLIAPDGNWEFKDWQTIEHLPEFRLMHPDGGGDRFSWHLEYVENARQLRETILCFCIILCDN